MINLFWKLRRTLKGRHWHYPDLFTFPPRCTVVAEVTCLTSMDGKFQVHPSPVFLRDNPNVYCKPIVYDMSPDKE